MSLPAGFVDELRSRLSLAEVVARKVTWDARKTNTGKGDYWAPCPFHQEKTASFHVDDRKGFYYCFGCHAKGDAIGFVRESENMGFMDAIKLLAAEAGMPVPAADPREAKRAKKRAGLVEVMEMAVRHYRLQLNTAAAQGARAYLEQRGMSAAMIEQFEIGFAPDTRGNLFSYLKDKDIPPEQMIEAGLCIAPDSGGQPFDRFRGRIMFPIRDQRGRAIAFGGRAMDPNARAKYLNSPETPLFDKGRNLYNLGPARAAAGKADALIVAEGYMDVIALVQAGFGHAVAPLGTAITQNQLHLMWRVTPEPVIALDGDSAGLRAAIRLIDVVLPLLEPGKSLRFCMMPQGVDPDDLIKASGAAAMQALLDKAQPLVDLLWQRETEGKVFDSPDRKAMLDASLKAALAKIEHPDIRNHYNAAIRDKRRALFSSQRPGKKFTPWRKNAPALANPETKASLLARAGNGIEAEARIRESAILLGCLNHPEIAQMLEDRLEHLPFICADLHHIANAMLGELHRITTRDAMVDHIAHAINDDPIAKLTAIGQVRDNPHLRPDADPELARKAIEVDMARQQAILGVMNEVREAEELAQESPDEGLTWRLDQARIAEREADSGGITEEDNSEIEAEAQRKLQAFIDQKIWEKKK